jgi:multiple sugar transport system permease protein
MPPPRSLLLGATMLLSRKLNNSNVLGILFMLPSAILLVLFLTYPLGLGVWLGFTNADLGSSGKWIGLDNICT